MTHLGVRSIKFLFEEHLFEHRLDTAIANNFCVRESNKPKSNINSLIFFQFLVIK